MSLRGFVKRVFKKQIQKALRDKIPTSNPQQILSMIKHDSQTNFRHYRFVRQLFTNALNQKNYILVSKDNSKKCQQNQSVFKQTLSTIGKYPMFELDMEGMKNFNKLISDNIHQKDNELLEKSLVFLIIADPHVQSSPIYIEFVKHYVKDNIQLIKSQLSINLDEQNLLNTIKLFFLRVFQRGFLPRHPSYTRQLYINNHTLLLTKILTHNKSLLTSMMLKKVHHQNFMKIKHFYEQQMKQNLYHEKNLQLMEKLVEMVLYLCKSFELGVKVIEHECKYLRELYVKLFLVIDRGEMRNCVVFYDMVKKDGNNKEKQDGSQKLLDRFIKKVQALFQSIESFKTKNQSQQRGQPSQPHSINLQNQQLLLILKHAQQLNLQPLALTQLVDQFAKRIQSALVFKTHFHQVLKLINRLIGKNVQLSQVNKALQNQDTYELLDLGETLLLVEQSFVAQNYRVKIAISKSIEKKDIKHVGNLQILNLLKLYINLTLQDPLSDLDHFKRQQTLIKFILRFLSDHHHHLPFDQVFQQILEIIFGIHNQGSKSNLSILDKDFNEKDGNYPHTILQQLQNHLKKHHWKIKNSALKNCINEKLNL